MVLGMPASAAGLYSKLDRCKDNASFVLPAGIATSIVTSMANTLVGSAITSAVNYLNAKQASTYMAVLPVDDASQLISTASGKCLYISSTPIESVEFEELESVQARSTFFASIAMIPARSSGSEIFRPVVRSWNYSNFLQNNCPIFRNCSRRDLVLKITFEAPALPSSTGALLAEPIGASWMNISRRALPSALLPNSRLPWVRSSNLQGPVNVRVSLTETSNPNQFTAAMAAALESQRKNIQASVESRLKGQPDSTTAQATRDSITMASESLVAFKNEFNDAMKSYQLYRDATDLADRSIYLAEYQTKRKTTGLRASEVTALFRSAGLSAPELPQLP
jgi:hypothetical protein